MSRADISRCGRRWVLLLARCLAALVILDGVSLLSGLVLAQEPGPAGSAPATDAPIGAGIDLAKLQDFLSAQLRVDVLEAQARITTEKVQEAEATLRLAEDGLSVTSLDTARFELARARVELDKNRKRLEEARDQLEKERLKLSPDDRVDLAIFSLAGQLRLFEIQQSSFLASPAVYRTADEAPRPVSGAS